MNSLEFINQNIFECKNHIEHLEIKIIEDKKYPSLVKYHKERIEELKPILKQLQQIKTVLEAWEISKTKQVDLYDIIHTANYEIYKLQNDDLLKQYILTNEEYKLLKEVLKYD